MNVKILQQTPGRRRRQIGIGADHCIRLGAATSRKHTSKIDDIIYVMYVTLRNYSIRIDVAVVCRRN
jgi:hypothetical protein